VYRNALLQEFFQELKRINPVLETGRRKSKHHQWFPPDFGRSKLKEHLVAVMALMRAAHNWEVFHRSLQRAFPKRTNWSRSCSKSKGSSRLTACPACDSLFP